MTLQELKYLVALADHGHFGRAAEACFITQSTLSTQIKKLEDFLGVTLFDRSLKRVTPTPIGREILAAARNIVEESERIRELAKHAQDPMSRTLHLGVIPTLGPYYLPHALTLVHRKHPGLRLLLREEMTPQILEHLVDGRLDAGLLALPVTDDSLRVEPLFYEPFFAALPAGHALAKQNVLKVSDIMNEKLLLLDEGHCLRDQALDVCGTGSRGREEVRATSLETLRQMVAMGLGLTLMPALSVDAAPRANKKAVEIRPFKKPAPGRTIGLVWRKRAPFPETFERLAATLKATLPTEVEPV
ncbi:MAG: LysR family transcriptional regulator [Thiobacillus sp.]|uniref:LysR substrate-binding domain-containing protein n=1 Tax=unclassified Thiobacillus TaxID=2646513 RepID=UPI0008690001|nr:MULTISPECIES: LysR substrate-binding domain-containing protein [unclassified Thiobacillus]MBS0311802.1 LysR family transcriptional regulator [Pseudomonadota bacterium]MBN8771385.1 LysR family transcriptional regulator [Thiobacillus sp.]MBN8778560.1 LysR family transcriptional regulator [Thiobacillus sp.]MBS0329868.1 LysR family transcriptional regulator [Pseudomonadota bacterium]ODV04850.1 MAG: DNA-binding transcriptional regulator OxyR [Thiobacillus sp. SCN 63-57]